MAPRWMLPVLVFLSLSATALAQRPTNDAPPWSVSAIGGLGRTWNDESQIGMGVLAGGRADAVLARHLRIEGGVDWLRHDRDQGVFRSAGSTTLLTAALRLTVGGSGGGGYVLAGPALAFHSGTTSFEDRSRDVSSTDGGLSFGGGFAGSIGPRAEIGPEARMVILWAEHGSAPAYAIYGGVRVAFR